MTKIRRKALIALGSNENSAWGDRAETIQKASQEIEKLSLSRARLSSSYATPAFPAGAGHEFVNAAMVIVSDLEPAEILAALHRIEADAGRARHVRWGQRTLDLDLIACAADVIPDIATFEHWRDLPLEVQTTTAPECLILPHPRLQDRAFVLVPLADVARDWSHPVSGLTVGEMLAALPASDRRQVRRLNP